MQFVYTHEYKPNSTNLDRVYFNESSGTLLVKFLNGGEAAYRNVTRSLFEQLKGASSSGSFYSRHIRNNVPGLTKPADGWQPVRTATLEIAQPQNFVVKGVVAVERKVVATSMEEAVKKFKSIYPESKVTEATVKFE